MAGHYILFPRLQVVASFRNASASGLILEIQSLGVHKTNEFETTFGALNLPREGSYLKPSDMLLRLHVGHLTEGCCHVGISLRLSHECRACNKITIGVFRLITFQLSELYIDYDYGLLFRRKSLKHTHIL